jgi:1-acyl-sn-glycerol-3-phosphate acyltransferase
MLARLRALDPAQPLWQILFYRFGYWLLFSFFVLFYRARFFGTLNIPDSGGLLIIANHQSHLDPPLVGVGIRRRNMAAIAREGLFRTFPLGLMLRGVGCIPIKEESGDAGAMRTAIEQLKRGRVVVIFPEGSRSTDGALTEFKRGVWLLMMRSGVPVLPAAVEGCFDAWPRQRSLPHLFGHRIAVGYGQPIPFADLKAMGSEKGLARLAADVESLRLDLRERLRTATHGRLPKPGPGDRRSVPTPG